MTSFQISSKIDCPGLVPDRYTHTGDKCFSLLNQLSPLLCQEPEVEEERLRQLYLCYWVCTSDIWLQGVPNQPLKLSDAMDHLALLFAIFWPKYCITLLRTNI